MVFCDGIQVDAVEAGWIDAQWYRYDCVNNTPMIGAPIGAANGCGGIETPARASEYLDHELPPEISAPHSSATSVPASPAGGLSRSCGRWSRY